MTVYSQHPNRGKVQILATYRGPGGVVSSTVTSVDDSARAAPIVDALNRISACATVPVSVWDTRGDRVRSYPDDHLAALTAPSVRGELLEGAHSLWYEKATWLLHQALTDLDAATAAVPAPVQKAITAELETEARGLRDALVEYSEGIEIPETENQRYWDFQSPFVAFEGGLEGLSAEDRERLNRMERGATAEQLRQGVADLRLLLDAHARCTNAEAMFMDDFTITDDPFDYYLNVDAPRPNGKHGRDDWRIEIGLWVSDLDDPDDLTSATGQTVVSCFRPAPPTVAEIVTLLNRSGGRSEQLAAWAKTPVGEALDGTDFVVTQRYDN
ncbi:hypothetical protein [Allokutzneria oryzae]|uniref:Uncharacterized protein n=1 Tax=Allokutzneria oryzae TaxID=1378989 RepID=A0ABV5ZPM9_9PSEU